MTNAFSFFRLFLIIFGILYLNYEFIEDTGIGVNSYVVGKYFVFFPREVIQCVKCKYLFSRNE